MKKKDKIFKKTADNLKFIVFLAIIAHFVFLPGCEKKTQQIISNSSIVAKKHIKTAKVKDLQKRLDLLMSPIEYRYTPVGKPDPFLPFIRPSLAESKTVQKKAGPAERCATALECIDVGQLHVVAIIDKGVDKVAMVQDATSTGYFLTKGTKVGYHKGSVKKIYPDKVIISEESEDIRGNIIRTDRVLLLHMEEQNEEK
jgi:Tfp pilus assembly protein PilP